MSCLHHLASVALITSFCAEAVAEEGPSFIIPPGREEIVTEWLEPIRSSGFAGHRIEGISVHLDEIRVILAGEGALSGEECLPPTWAKRSAGLVLRRVSHRSQTRVSGSDQQGTVEHEWLHLSWFLCRSNMSAPETRPSEASRRLVEELARTDPDTIWIRPRPQGTPHWPLWPLGLGVVLVVIGLACSSRRRIALGLLTLAAFPLAMGIVAAWEERFIVLLWLALLVPLVVAIVLISKGGKVAVATFVVPTVVSFLFRALADHGPANWYVSLAAVPGAVQAPFNRFQGGLSLWTQLVSPVFTIGPEHVFALSVVSSSLAVGLLVSALDRAIDRDELWPKGSQFLWGGFLTIDCALIWLGASDAPHNVALFAFGLVLWLTVEASDDVSPQVWLLLAIGLCSALVGLTRPELVLAPIACSLLLGLGGKRESLRRFLGPSIASAIGVVVAVALWSALHAAHLTDQAFTSGWFAGLSLGLLDQAPWNVELSPFFRESYSIVAALLFIVICWKRYPLMLAIPAYFIAVLPKVLAGFGGAHIGPIGPSQRYNIIVIPIALLIFSGGLLSVGAPLLSWIRQKENLWKKGVALLAGLFLASWIISGGAEVLRESQDLSFRVEYRFLRDHLNLLPRHATVGTVWLEHLGQRDLDAQLALPHGLLSLARPDLRWVAIDRETQFGEIDYYYRGSTCSLDERKGMAVGIERAEDRRLVSDSLERCAQLERSVSLWLVESEVAVEQGTWTMGDGRISLGLGRRAP